MKLQDILDPIATFIVWTFESILEVLGNSPVTPNLIFIIVGFVGLVYWLRLQGKFNEKAKSGGLK